ncbi:MAG: hypothetical protein V4710_02215 [Verrucomicrobiota bacterium]
MKLGKDEISRLILGSILAIGVIYCYFTMLLGPLQTKQIATRKLITDIDPKIAEANGVVKKSIEAIKNEPATRNSLAQIDAMSPSGSPVAWFPPRVTDFFKTHSIDKGSLRLMSEASDKMLPEFRRMAWSLDFPKIDFVPFAIALAEFENAEPLVEVINVVIESNRDNVETQRAVLTLNNLVKK